MNPQWSPRKKKAIFFDLNETLLDTRRTFTDSFVTVLQDYIGRWNPDEGVPLEQVAAQYQSEWRKRIKNKKKSAVPMDRIRRTSLAAALNPLPLPTNRAFVETFLQKVDQVNAQQPKLYPGAREALQFLSRHYKLALISNGKEEKTERYINRLHLQDYFPASHRFTSVRKDRKKPNAYLFLQALKALQISKEEAVMVGNSWHLDILGAVRCGIDAIWFDPLHKEKNSHKSIGSQSVYIVRSWEQLASLFAPHS
ncbi:HAD family hydrolase [Paenibacillus senegalensis]|uniref:HAD family hydrolase n=1 Tax=Paenibacillus senegalensis TaxID=1465766 RepID=UPI0002896106|nr:HAD family hydrolase [Paenibacillus senegalensis]